MQFSDTSLIRLLPSIRHIRITESAAAEHQILRHIEPDLGGGIVSAVRRQASTDKSHRSDKSW
jgi:hypothetical protein